MPIELKMPALSPTMEEGTLAKWLVKEGDTVASGDILAEIETDKATMEFEAVDEGTIAKILVPEGTDEVKVGTVIALIAEEGEDASSVKASAPAKAAAPAPSPAPAAPTPAPAAPASAPAPQPAAPAAPAKSESGDRIKASPLARRLAEAQGIDLAGADRLRPRRPDRQGRHRGGDRQGAGARRHRGAAPPKPARPPRRRPRSRPTSRTRSSSSPTCARRSPAA